MGWIDFTGDIQRFIIAGTFVGGFLYFIYVMGEVVKRLPIEEAQIDLNTILVAVITGLLTLVSAVSTFYFAAKAVEKAQAQNNP